MQTWDVNKIPRIKEHRRLPIALSSEEIKSIFNAVENIKYKAILMTIYSCGLRVSEVCNLKIADVYGKNMKIFIRQGKGKKDGEKSLSLEEWIEKANKY